METVTAALHRLTSYEPARDWLEPIDDPQIVQDLVANDLDRFPWFFKRYDPVLPRTPLPRELPEHDESCVAVLAGASQVPGTLDLAELSRLLFRSAGVVRWTDRPYARWYFRAAGSAGGRFPLELYAVIPQGAGIAGLEPGVHWFDPAGHALLRVGPAPAEGAPSIVVTGVPWRTGWRYRERGYRHVYWDAGTMLSQLLATAASAGLPARLFTRFAEGGVAELVGADGVHEWPVAVVALAAGEPGLVPAGPAARGALDSAPLEFPLVTAAQRAGAGAALGHAWKQGDPVPDSGGPSLDQVISARGSQRLLDPAGAAARETVEQAMRLSMRGIEVPHFVVANNVTGLDRGVYRWPDLGHPVHAGDLREELFRVCLDQGLPRDAAFVVVGATDVARLSDAQYREAQLAAGVVEGRLHLLAYALGLAASGMTFYDSEIAALLNGRWDGLLFTCVGVPEYRSSPGGRPGEPTAVRMVAGR
jgi:SagB-type dehydrogenase family enzyme